MNNILVMENDQSTSKWLFSFLTNAGYEINTASSAYEGLGKVIAEKPDLIILDLGMTDLNGEQVVESITQNPVTAKIPIIILIREHDPQVISRLFDKGIADFIVKKPGIDAELLVKIPACLQRARHATKMLTNGRLISFFSAKGGNGTSTLCLNLAHMLAQQVTPKRVLVADLVLPLGSLALVTGSQQNGSIAGLTNEGGPYDHKKLKSYLTPADVWNFSVLSGSQNPLDAQMLEPGQIDPLFESLRLVFNYVIVDLGKTLSRISLPILQNSDAVVIVVGPDLVTAELTLAALQFLGESGVEKERLFLILNRAVGREGITKVELESKFNLPIQGAIPYVQDNFTLASNQNLPFSQRFPQDSTTIVLNDLAALLNKQINEVHDLQSA